MINFDCDAKQNIKDHNPHWQRISDYPDIVLIMEALYLKKKMHYLI